MGILQINNENRFLAYQKYNTTKKHSPTIIFHHGLMSNMQGKKALWLERYCKSKEYNFVRFDNFGHGQSSGEFSEQTISDWEEGLNLIIDNLSVTSVILVGSSMGVWITSLVCMKRPEKIVGMVGISSAPDFSEELIWNKLTEEQKEKLQSEGIFNFRGSDPNCQDVYRISFDLIKDGRNHLLLNKENIDIKCPVHLIHGMQDTDVPFSISERLSSKITHQQVVLKLIKDGDHRLSRQEDLEIISNSISEIISLQHI
jgi:uncharacterized protein